MHTRYFTAIALFMGVLLYSCDTKKAADTKVEEETKEETYEPKEPKCTYAYVHDSTSVKWTAFKFTEKAGVGGKFDACEVKTPKESGSIEDLLTGLKFSIPVNSSNSNNEDRDKKILESFWGTLSATENITGTISKVSHSGDGGSVTIALTMNEKEQEVEGAYEIDDSGVFNLMAGVDMTAFDGLGAIAALNEVCKDLHTGADGVSKLWPTVDVMVSGYLKKDCTGQ